MQGDASRAYWGNATVRRTQTFDNSNDKKTESRKEKRRRLQEDLFEG